MSVSVKPGPPRIALLAFVPLLSGAVVWNAAAGRLAGGGWTVEIAGGLGLWTLVEYLGHRFLFHFVPRSAWLLERQQHLAHHQSPSEPAYYVVPLWFTIPVALLIWGALGLVAGGPRAALLTAGTVLGYIAYELIHYEIHRGREGGPLMRFWRRHHFHHHFTDADRCFGFTTPFWDWVFGTGPVRRKPQ